VLPSAIGDRAEAAVLAALVATEKQVLVPFGGHERFDVAYFENGELVRVQCKTGVLREGVISFRTHSKGRSSVRDYRQDAEYFGVYCHERREVYLVPVAEVPVRAATLRLTPTRNSQSHGIRMAGPYLLAENVDPSQLQISPLPAYIDNYQYMNNDERMARKDIELLPVSCCAPLAATSISDDQAQATADLFKSLADPHRVKIVNLLANCGEPVCVCDINEEVNLAQPTISFHLKKLAASGLLKREQRGTWAYYSLDDAAMEVLGSVVKAKGGLNE
jgi:ArsR family transcriptional regulator